MPTDPTTLNSRDRLLRTAEDLFRRQGYSGTGLKEISAMAPAPWGSIYHFFPGGKQQLGVEVMHFAAELYRKGIVAAFARHPDPAAAVEAIFQGEVKILERSQYAAGCPVAAVTLDVASINETLREACGQAFGRWLEAYASGFRAAGAPAKDARALAGFALSALEGAIVLSRATRSTAPLRQSAKFVRDAVAQQAAGWSAAGA